MPKLDVRPRSAPHYEGEYVPMDGRLSLRAQRATPRGRLALTPLWMSLDTAMIRSEVALSEGELLELELPLGQGVPARIRARVTESSRTRSGEVAILELAAPARYRESFERFLHARRAK